MMSFVGNWEAVNREAGVLQFIRVAPEHPLDLFVGYAADGCRVFILESPSGLVDKAEMINFENIEISTESCDGSEKLTLKLLASDLRDLFSSICVDLVDASATYEKIDTAITIFFGRLDRWATLLKEGRRQGLSDEAQLGLVGELYFVERLLSNSISSPSAVVTGWRGPDGDSRDLTIGIISVEIKTKFETSKNFVGISSIDQLETFSKRSFLAVYRFSPSDTGISMKCLADRILSMLGASSELGLNFARKLYLAGYDPSAAYVDEHYEKTKLSIYEVRDDFPRLVRSCLPSAIASASYQIDLSKIAEYKFLESDLLEALDG